MKIIIATGIYPPEVGGPSEYARQMFETLSIQNHSVSVVTYGELKKYPTGIRHILYFCKLFFDALDADYIIALDTFSVALPSLIFSKLWGNKIVVRVAGDFLWESYVERTREPIMLSQFYTAKRHYTIKEKIIFLLTRFILRSADALVFSTEWQKNIMLEPYNLDASRVHIIENYYSSERIMGEREGDKKIFLSPSRDRVIKNKNAVVSAFTQVKEKYNDVFYDDKIVSHEMLAEKISRSYAVIVASYSEVSPNLVIEALQYCTPVIVTKDTGISERLQSMVIEVDPFDIDDMVSAVERLLVPEIYATYKQRIYGNTFSHSWNEIAQEFIDVYNTLR